MWVCQAKLDAVNSNERTPPVSSAASSREKNRGAEGDRTLTSWLLVSRQAIFLKQNS